MLQGWAQSTLNNLTALPVTLVNNGTQVVSPALGSAIGAAQQLQSSPNDQTAKNELMFTLDLLSSNLNLMSGMTAPVITSMQNQATVFDQNAATMNAVAAAALQTAGNDGGQITQLNQQISSLQSDIKAQTAAIVGGSLVAVLGIGMGILAIALAPATGGVSLFPAGPGCPHHRGRRAHHRPQRGEDRAGQGRRSRRPATASAPTTPTSSA